MNTCVACAERDKSCPYDWRMAIDCVYLGGRNMMNHAPTAHALPYSTYPFFLRILPIPPATFKENIYICDEILSLYYASFFVTFTTITSSA